MKGIEELQFDDRDSEKGLEELSKQSELESSGNILEYTDTCFTSPRGIIAARLVSLVQRSPNLLEAPQNINLKILC